MVPKLVPKIIEKQSIELPPSTADDDDGDDDDDEGDDDSDPFATDEDYSRCDTDLASSVVPSHFRH